MLNRAYLSLGSNIGDREAQLREAVTQLGALGRVAALSSFYETEPVEFTEQAWFLNCALAIETAEAPQELMAEILPHRRANGTAASTEQRAAFD